MYYGPGTHYATTMSSDEEREEDEDEPEAEDSDDDEHLGLAPAGFRTSATVLPRVTWRGRFKKTVRRFASLEMMMAAAREI